MHFFFVDGITLDIRCPSNTCQRYDYTMPSNIQHCSIRNRTTTCQMSLKCAAKKLAYTVAFSTLTHKFFDGLVVGMLMRLAVGAMEVPSDIFGRMSKMRREHVDRPTTNSVGSSTTLLDILQWSSKMRRLVV